MSDAISLQALFVSGLLVASATAHGAGELIEIGKAGPELTAYFVDGSSAKAGIANTFVRVQRWDTPQTADEGRISYDEERDTVAALCIPSGVSAEEFAKVPWIRRRPEAIRFIGSKQYLRGRLVWQSSQGQVKNEWKRVYATTNTNVDEANIMTWWRVEAGSYGAALREVACDPARRASLKTDSRTSKSGPYDCSRSGQYYQDRYLARGRIEDMVCAKRAMQRELNLN